MVGYLPLKPMAGLSLSRMLFDFVKRRISALPCIPGELNSKY